MKKKDVLRICGADLRLVPAAPYKDPKNYVRYSEALAKDAGTHDGGVIWANQFDNLANMQGHYASTGPEIWRRPTTKLTVLSALSAQGNFGRCRVLSERAETHPSNWVWQTQTDQPSSTITCTVN